MATDGWLGCYRVGNRVGVLPNMGSGNWTILIRRLMATVAMRCLSCDLGTRLHICDLGTGLHRKRKQSKIRRKTDKEERRRQGGREGARYSEAACSPRVQLQEMMRN